MEIFPKNVKLIEPDDFETHRAAIFDNVHKALVSSFPRTHGGVRMELGNTGYEGPEDFTPAEQKAALLGNKFLTRRLRGTVNLYDDKTNELLDSTHTTLMNVPWLTQRGTFVHGGNDYAPINQMRLVPGPYGRVMSNGQLEVHFNPKPGTGMGYRVLLEPDTAQYKLRIGPGMHAHLYSVLHDMGVGDDDLEKTWGPDVLARNKSKYNPKAIKQVYGRLVPPRDQNPEATPQEQAEALHAAFGRTQILSSVARQHLPDMFDAIKKASIISELRETDSHDAEDIHDQFKPDLTPSDLRENINALQGKAGPALAGGAWPAHWSTEQDPMGWLAWYEQYHHGRRTDDDRGQIQRWLRFRRLQLPKFSREPTARRAFSLRNWAIDPEKHVSDEELPALQAAMKKHKDAKWQEWIAKSASFSVPDLQSIALYLNQNSGASIATNTSEPEMEQAILDFVGGHTSSANMAMLQAGQQASKMATLAAFIRNRPEVEIIPITETAVTIKYANVAPFEVDDTALDLLCQFLEE